MKVSVEKLENSRAKVVVEFTLEEVNEKYEAALNGVVSKHEEKGYRKGHFPSDKFVKKYGDTSVLQELVEKLIHDTYIEVLKQNNVQAISQPEIDFDYKEVGKDKPFKYSMEMDVYPEVVLGQYKGIEVVKDPTDVSEKDINDYVERELKNHSDLELVEEGALEKGNTAVFDFSGSVNGEKFEGGTAENYTLEIGSGNFIPGFEEQMVGMQKEEVKVITVHFPKEYQAKELADKDAQFEIKLHEIKKRVLPELNDEFVKTLEIEEVVTVDDWKKHLGEILASEKAEASDNKFKYELIETACNNATVFIPESMVDNEVEYNLNQMTKQAQAYGITLEQFLTYQGTSLEQYKELSRPGAKFNVLRDLVLAAIIKEEKLELTDSDYEKYYADLAKQYNQTVEKVKETFSKEKVVSYFLSLKATDVIFDSAIIK